MGTTCSQTPTMVCVSMELDEPDLNDEDGLASL